jgi:hypothetical protein
MGTGYRRRPNPDKNASLAENPPFRERGRPNPDPDKARGALGSLLSPPQGAIWISETSAWLGLKLGLSVPSCIQDDRIRRRAAYLGRARIASVDHENDGSR